MPAGRLIGSSPTTDSRSSADRVGCGRPFSPDGAREHSEVTSTDAAVGAVVSRADRERALALTGVLSLRV